MGRRKRLLNRSEETTHQAIVEAAERADARVHLKVRVADVLDLDDAALTPAEHSYGLKSHFDFVIYDADLEPEFAIEFDGPHHEADPDTIARDGLKNAICEKHGFTLIRIDADYWRTEGRFTLVGWLIDVWFHQKAFYEAQAAGTIPYDEPFIYFSVFEHDARTGRLRPIYALDAEARLAMQAAHRRGQALQPVPQTIKTPWDADRSVIECYCVFALNRSYIIGQARLRSFGSGFGVAPGELVEDLAVADAGKQLDAVLAGTEPPATADEVRQLLDRTADWDVSGSPLPPIPN